MKKSVLRYRTAVLLITLSISALFSKAQSVSVGNVEVGIGLGPIVFLGDLGGNLGKGTKLVKDVNLPTTNLIKGLSIHYYPVEWLGFRGAINLGKLEGADSLINEKGGLESYRKVRNLHFRSPLREAYAALEFYPTVFMEQYDGLQGKLRPYGLIGVGMFQFSPEALYYSPNGTTRWVNLQKLRTEGQGMAEYPDRKVYNLTQMEIPMGGGAKYYLSESMFVGLEILHRKTFTDYVDDLSTTYIDANLFDKYLAPQDAQIARQVYNRGYGPASRAGNGDMRGQKKNNDSFFSSVLRFGWRLNYESLPNQLRCPKF